MTGKIRVSNKNIGIGRFGSALWLAASLACATAAQTLVSEMKLPDHRTPNYDERLLRSFLCELPDDRAAIASTVDGAIRITAFSRGGDSVSDTLVYASRDYVLRCLGFYRAPDHLVLAAWRTTRSGAVGDSSGQFLLHLSYKLLPIREVYPAPYWALGAMDGSGNIYSTGPGVELEIIKISPDGNKVFERRFDSAHSIGKKLYGHIPARVRVLSDGNIYVAGYFAPPQYPTNLSGDAGFVFKMSPGGDSLGFVQYPDSIGSNEFSFRDVSDDGENLFIVGDEYHFSTLFLAKTSMHMPGPILARQIEISPIGKIRGNEIAYNQAKRRFYVHGVNDSSYLYSVDANLDSLQLLRFTNPSFNEAYDGANDMLLTRNGVLYISVKIDEPVQTLTGLPILQTLTDEAPARLIFKGGKRTGAASQGSAAWLFGYSASGRWLLPGKARFPVNNQSRHFTSSPKVRQSN